MRLDEALAQALQVCSAVPYGTALCNDVKHCGEARSDSSAWAIFVPCVSCRPEELWGCDCRTAAAPRSAMHSKSATKAAERRTCMPSV